VVEIKAISFGHDLWDKTIEFAEKCSWKAGSFLALKMRNNDFEKIRHRVY